MIERGETKILFDPLFHYGPDTYDRVPAEVETALLAGIEPWDGIIEFGPLLVEAVRIPHSGWPDHRADVENIVFRVTLDKETTVMHFGDADVDLFTRPGETRALENHSAARE